MVLCATAGRGTYSILLALANEMCVAHVCSNNATAACHKNKATPAEIKAQLHAPVSDTQRKRECAALQYCFNFCDFQAFCKNHNSASGVRLRVHAAHR